MSLFYWSFTVPLLSGGTQHTFTVSIERTSSFPATATAVSMLQPKKELHEEQLLITDALDGLEAESVTLPEMGKQAQMRYLVQ